MDEPDLFDRVSARLLEARADFDEIAKRAGLSTKTLYRIAHRQNDAMHGTLKRIEGCLSQMAADKVTANTTEG